MKKILILGLLLLCPQIALAQGAINGTEAVVSERNIIAFDCSGTVTAGGTSQLLITVSGSSPTKTPNIRGFTLMNVDTTAENLCISFTGTAGAAQSCSTTGYYGLQPATASANGGSYSSQLGFGPGNNPVIVAATTGHKFTCTYW